MKENEADVNRKESMMLLAGDVGGTKTLLGLFNSGPTRPQSMAVRAFRTLDFSDLGAMIEIFMSQAGAKTPSIAAACFGVAGPILGDTAALTNVPWRVEASQVATRFGVGRVSLLNDLQAMAYAVPVLQLSEVHTLQEGGSLPDGNMALIAAGTGLGIALLHNVNGRFIPSASEGGHADFAARTEREVTVLRRLTTTFGRVEVERVVSGPGLVNIHRALQVEVCAAHIDLDSVDAPAAISNAALEGVCRCCVQTLEMFVEAYGAAAGNLALQTVSTSGLFVGGGIAPKILPALTTGAFMRVFRAKAPFESLLEKMPVKVILNAEAGLLGAAVYAQQMCSTT
jgi:glucokinase